MIEIKNLTKRYSNHVVLNDVNRIYPDNGLFYIVGKSGAGKSTLIQLLGMMDYEYEGSIKCNNKELKEMTEDEKANYRYEVISFLFQSYHAEDNESVISNLMKVLDITSLTDKEKEERIDDLLKQVDLSDKKNQTFKTLSGGEKKRISFVRALLKQSPILLADEPLSSLNKHLREKLTTILLNESKRRLVLIITHEKDEIPDSAFIDEIKEGKLVPIKIGVIPNKKNLIIDKRIEFKGKSFIRQLLSSMKRRRDLFFITIFSLMIGLFAINFSFQLSLCVSNSIKDMMLSYMDEDTLVISSSDEGYSHLGFQTGTYQKCAYLANRYKDEVISPSSFYESTLDNIFTTNQTVSISYNDSELVINPLSLNSFIEYRMNDEVDVDIYGEEETELDEVIIAINEDYFKALYKSIFKSTDTIENMKIAIANKVKSGNISLLVKANNPNWLNYDVEYSYKIKGIIIDDFYIVNSSNIFADTFIKEVMHFKEIQEEDIEDKNTPWVIKKSEGLRLKPNKTGDFLMKFLKDDNVKEYTLKQVKTTNYYLEEDVITHNHVSLVKDYLPKVRIPDINSFIDDNIEYVKSVKYSSSVYTYTASGYISGFNKPFFFSKFKEKLNTIEDNLYFTEENLGSFQGSLIDDIDGVIKADLISSMDSKDSLSLDNYDDKTLLCGSYPENTNEICISSSLAKELFNDNISALNSKLNTLTLYDTKKKDDGYRNLFLSGSLLIKGIIEDDKKIIYQDSLFPLCYLFQLGGLLDEEVRITSAVIEVDLEKNSLDFYLTQLKKYGDYTGSFPMYNMIKEIQNTLSLLSTLFLSFSLLSLISGGSLLFLSMFLIIQKDQKEIGILLSLGYKKKEISRFYLFFSLFIGLLGYVFSLFISLLTEKIMQKTLLDMLNSYSFSFIPYLISFIIGFILSLCIGFLISKEINKCSPKDAFDKVKW